MGRYTDKKVNNTPKAKKLQKENEELKNDNKYLRERETYLEKRRLLKQYEEMLNASFGLSNHHIF